MTKNQLILGEVVGDGTIKPLDCDIPGVTARQTTRKAAMCHLTNPKLSEGGGTI